MKKIFILSILFILFITALKSDKPIANHPITSPMEPEAFLGGYTEIILKMDDFQKKSGFDAKIFELFALSAARASVCITARASIARRN